VRRSWCSGTGFSARASVLALVVGGGFAVVALTGPLSVDRVRGLAGVDHPVWGPAVFVVVSALLSLVLFPWPLLAGAAGLLFGTALGTPLAIVSAVLGAVAGCALSRTLATGAVLRLSGPRMLRVRDWITRRGFAGVLLLRVAPGVPYNLVNYGVGLTTIPVVVLAGATAVGVAPRALAYTALGGSLGSLDSWQSVAAVALLAVMAVAGIALAARDPELRALTRRRPAEPPPAAGRGADGTTPARAGRGADGTACGRRVTDAP
jgi:uncharacterized membrane protein YdjX (TVP38/TMEM64 family)